jgi:hypothetical protein
MDRMLSSVFGLEEGQAQDAKKNGMDGPAPGAVLVIGCGVILLALAAR